MQRLFFLIPDVDKARIIVDELLLMRVAERRIHVVANDNIVLKDIPEASIWQKTDLIPALERGLITGGIAGFLLGIVLLAFTQISRELAEGAIVLFSVVVAAAIGAWISSLIGIRLPHRNIEQFEQAIEDGQLLMLVDVPVDRVQDITSTVKYYPEVDLKYTEASISQFP